MSAARVAACLRCARRTAAAIRFFDSRAALAGSGARSSRPTDTPLGDRYDRIDAHAVDVGEAVPAGDLRRPPPLGCCRSRGAVFAKYVHRRRAQLAAQATARKAARAGVVAGFVPQCHPPGAEAEVDVADLWVSLTGEMIKCVLFTLRLSHSGRAVHRVFASQGQEAFLEGHVAAFEALGGVPFDKIPYDNLRSAVHRCCSGATAPSPGAG